MRRYAIPAKALVIPKAEEEELLQQKAKETRARPSNKFSSEPERAESKNVIEL